MKKTIILVFLFSGVHLFAQVNIKGNNDNMFMLALGPYMPFTNNYAFNHWTAINYHNQASLSMGAYLDAAIVLKSTDFGVQAALGVPYGIGSLYWGKRITPEGSNVSSFLNMEFGSLGFSPPSVDAPLNYIPTSDQAGKTLHLKYQTFYFGLASKNYINKLSFKSGKGKKSAAYNVGILYDINYEPWEGTWEYGYTEGIGKYAHFISNKVYGIPSFSKFFMSAGLFISIGS